MSAKIHTVSPADDGMRLHRWFKTHYDLSFVQVQKKCRTGEIRIDGRRAKANHIVHTGTPIRIPPLRIPPLPIPPLHQNPQNCKVYNPQDAAYIRNLVIYKDDHIIALNKPAGIAVQGGAEIRTHIDGLTRYLHRDSEQKPRLVHRLDKDTSGVLLLARTRLSAAHLGRAFNTGKVRKIYWALVVGEPKTPTGTIDAPLLKTYMGATEKVVVDANGKRAVTEYAVLQRMGGVLSLVALYPRTGRTHQIRVHMAYLNTPVLGDGKYGGRSAFVSGDTHMKKMHLHARTMCVDDTTITADLPPHFKATFDMFGIDVSPYYDTVFGGGHTCG